MFNRISILSIFFIFSFTMVAEDLKNKELHSNYKKITLNEKIQEMESLELSKEVPFREPNVKALEKRFMIKLQLLDMKRKADFIGKEPMIPSNGRGGCEEGYVDDCSGDGDCCPESWIGDGFADCEDQPWGCDMTCYDNDGGDCAGEGDGGDDGGDPTDDGGTGGDGGEEGCADDEFDCLGDGTECIPGSYECDVYWVDCSNGADEADCEGSDDGGDDGGVSSCEEIGGNESYLGDGWCDDINNNETCGYDSGDCCYSTCVSDAYDCEADSGPCAADICIDPDGNNDNCEAADDGGGDDGGECQNFDCMDQCYDGYEGWIGDGYCDDGSWGLYFNCEEFECDYGDCLNDDGSCAGNTDGGGDDGGEEGCADDQFTCNDGSCIPAAWECDVDWCDCADCEDEADCEGSDDGGTDGGEGCEEGFVDDCSGDGDCCPESWIGDGLFDCEDPNNYGCDLTCYDNDGGDCDEIGDDGGTDGGSEGCNDSQVEDCSDDDCCPASWIGDGFADCEDQTWGCDLSCYDNDGGDCDDSADDGGTDGGDDGGDDGGWETEAAVIIGNGSSIPGGEIQIPLLLESTVSVSGIQFTLNADPSNWQSVTDFSAVVSTGDCWEANFNNTDNGTIGLLYSLSGCEFSPSNESVEIGTLSFDVSDDAEWGGTIQLYFSELIVAGAGGEQVNAESYEGYIAIGTVGDVNHDGSIDVMDAVSMINFILQLEEPTESQVWAADINEDGALNILDVVLLVEMILGD